jgi:hypothetical protein
VRRPRRAPCRTPPRGSSPRSPHVRRDNIALEKATIIDPSRANTARSRCFAGICKPGETTKQRRGRRGRRRW